VFAGFSEPWANPLCNKLLQYVLEQEYNVGIYTTLYGLSKEDTDFAMSLIKKHKEQINYTWLHLPDAHNNMPGWKYSEKWQYAYERFSDIHATSMTLSSTSTVNTQIELINNVSSWYLHTRADNLDVSKIQDQHVESPPRNEFPIECTRDKNYHSNILLPNGDVVLCCMDYGLKHIIGNLLEQPYDEIVNSTEIDSVVKSNRKETFSNDTLCRTCNDTHCYTPYNTENYYDLYPEHQK
jgi:radical SAM protein with 4Fe4S-binding SPASM domain